MNDLINAGFEFGAAVAILNHCRELYRHKQVRGVSIASTVFFMLWGTWNIYYYPSLDQGLSFTAGLLVVAANALWVLMLVHYADREVERALDHALTLPASMLPFESHERFALEEEQRRGNINCGADRP